jgi:Domain of unknown function (DUF4340)
MNRKQVVILFVLVVVLGGAGLVIYKRQNSAQSAGDPSLGRKLLGEFPVNDVTAISIREGTNQVNLVKKDLWSVRERSDYPANYNEISDALIKLKDLKVIQTETVGASQLPRLGLASGQGSNSATTVEFKGQGDKIIRTLLLGKQHMNKSNRPNPQFGGMGDEGFPDGRYVKTGTDSGTVALVADSLSSLEPKPEQWLNKDFFKVEKVRSIQVNYPAATNSWKVTREGESGEWKLAEAKPGEQLDSTKSSGFSSALASPQFNDVATLASAPQHGLDKPTVVTLDTFDDLSYTLKVGQKTNDNYALTMALNANLPKERTPGKDEKPADKEKLDKEFREKQSKLQEKIAQEKAYEKWVYLVSSWTLDSVLKDRAQLMVEKKEEPKKETPAADASKPATTPAPAGTSTNALPKTAGP